MEIKLENVETIAWLLGVVVLVLIGLLVACGTTTTRRPMGWCWWAVRARGSLRHSASIWRAAHASAVEQHTGRHVE